MLQAFLCSVVCRERHGLIPYDNNDKLVEKKNHICELDAHFKRTCVKRIPCSMKILREFYFADWRFFVVCGNKFLRFEMTEISRGN